MFRYLVPALAAALCLTVASASPAQAQPLDGRAYFTFTEPVHVPGKVLPPGDYLFRFADYNNGGTVVQVLSADLSEVHGMFFTSRVMRPTAPDLPEISLGEAPEGQPRSISTWWHAGETIGREFYYAPGDASWMREAADEILRLVRNVEAAETQQHPLHRIMDIRRDDGDILITNDAYLTGSHLNHVTLSLPIFPSRIRPD